MNWRPENWPEIVDKLMATANLVEDPYASYQLIGMAMGLEAGADAMLEALKARGVHCRVAFDAFFATKDAKYPDGTNAVYRLAQGRNGQHVTLVPIPDGEGK